MSLATTAVLAQPGESPTTQPLEWRRLPELPDANGVAGAFGGAVDGTLLIAGGCNFPNQKPWEGGKKVFYDDILLLRPNATAWQHVGKLSRPSAYGASVSTADGVICIGGQDAENASADVFRLRIKAANVERDELPPLPEPIVNACGAAIGQTIYLAGGISSPDALKAESLSVFLSLDLAHPDRGWQRLPTWPGPGRFLAVAGVDGGAFYLFSGIRRAAGEGGKFGLEYLRDAYRFDPAETGGTWKRVADLPMPNAATPSPAPLIDGSKLLLLGQGANGLTNHLPMPERPQIGEQCLAYDTATNAWMPMGPMPAARVTAPAVPFANGVAILSGEIRPGVRSPEVWVGTPADAGSPGK